MDEQINQVVEEIERRKSDLVPTFENSGIMKRTKNLSPIITGRLIG